MDSRDGRETDKMGLFTLENLMARMAEEYSCSRSLFDIHESDWFRKENGRSYPIFGETAETIIGPAAGPHTQLAQNIVSSYLTGSRFIELKTVQIMDALEIEKPCIDAADEGYNTEWSTELSLDEAWEEYAKAWILLHLIEYLFDMKKGAGERSFIFNMSVGYDMAGIKKPPMAQYISRMKDSSREARFREWIDTLPAAASPLLKGTALEGKIPGLEELARSIRGQICSSVTLSTMHGCQPEEIEKICLHMIEDWNLDTYVKLNPTLLGFDKVRGILDDLGFGYVILKRESFDHDLQYGRALSILTNLRRAAGKAGRRFGVKLTNTLGTVNGGETLPGDEMYMSGRALFPLSLNLAARLSREFSGDLPISFSGGLSAFNCRAVAETGIKPLTMATEMLKPGGYLRQLQVAENTESLTLPGDTIDTVKLSALAEESLTADYGQKSFRPDDKVFLPGPLPFFDCAAAPCRQACAIGQPIPEYIRLVGEGRYAEAMACIYETNVLPAVTGHICDHRCQLVCTRLDYDGAVNIRDMKKIAWEKGFGEYRKGVKSVPRKNCSVAVIGAGPAGLSAAAFLARSGFGVTVFEREESAGGVVRNIIPRFRIPAAVLDSDIDFIRDSGVDFRFGWSGEIDVDDLTSQGFTYVLIAIGTYQTRPYKLAGDGNNIFPALDFLGSFNRGGSALEMGKDVAVVGAGDTAMDCARAALRCPGAEKVSLYYRRASEQMPASREEYDLARADGIAFHWLRNPVELARDGRLKLEIMTLGEPDESGRRRPVGTGEFEEVRADSLVYAIGDDAEKAVLDRAGLEFDKEGKSLTHDNVFLIGDSRTGGSTIVRCLQEGRLAAENIARLEGLELPSRDQFMPHWDRTVREKEIRRKKGRLVSPREMTGEGSAYEKQEMNRCLECSAVCNKCVDVCPNRANISIETGGNPLFTQPSQIVHLDAYCNECGNCAGFCPWEGRPYRDKPTLFSRREAYERSDNAGWYLEKDTLYWRTGGTEKSIPLARAAENEAADPMMSLFGMLYRERPSLFAMARVGRAGSGVKL